MFGIGDYLGESARYWHAQYRAQERLTETFRGHCNTVQDRVANLGSQLRVKNAEIDWLNSLAEEGRKKSDELAAEALQQFEVACEVIENLRAASKIQRPEGSPDVTIRIEVVNNGQ